MKKRILILLLLGLLALGLYSCKGTQDCPAYSDSQIEQPEQQV